ncbi:hypothetical protein ACX80E_15710 [Arthrobacter sp. TMN-49]
MAWRDAAVASGQKRYLARTNNGELVSYLREEYGAARGHSNLVVQTVWGWVVLTATMLFMVVVMVCAMVGSVLDGAGGMHGSLWFGLVFSLLMLLFVGRYLVIEAKATILRRQRGLPTPSGDTLPRWCETASHLFAG